MCAKVHLVGGEVQAGGGAAAQRCDACLKRLGQLVFLSVVLCSCFVFLQAAVYVREHPLIPTMVCVKGIGQKSISPPMPRYRPGIPSARTILRNVFQKVALDPTLTCS